LTISSRRLFIASKKTIKDDILTGFGWETIDIGGIEGARLLESLASV
jgi:predicted dinucleotide-binding enzyme